MSLANRVTLVIQITVIGTVIAFGTAFAYYQRDWLVPWKSLGTPPEKAVKIVSAQNGLWVEAISGQISQHKYDEDLQCKDKCWESSEYPEISTDTSWKKCDRPTPFFANPIDKETICNYWGPGISVYAYVINNKGGVFTWRGDIGEGGWLWAIPLALFYGLPANFVVALVIVIRKTQNTNRKDG